MIEIVVGAEVGAEFQARGSINTFNDEAVLNVATDADLRQILDDNGFEGLVVAQIEAAFVRVTKQDDNAADRTVTGTVTVRRTGTVVESALITNVTEPINDASLADWQPVPLETAGVSLINQAMAEYLLDLYNNVAVPREPNLTFTISGTSSPQGVTTNFDWEVKVKMNLVGSKSITVIEPI